MPNDDVGIAKLLGSKKDETLLERLEAFARVHPGQEFLVMTEQDAAELLTFLAFSIRTQEKTLSHPMELQGNDFDAMRKRHNKRELLQLRKTANRMLKAARTESAMAFCVEEFEGGLEYMGITIGFPPLKVVH